jgi:hypothetical protein
VAVNPDRDPKPVRCFGCFTADLRDMARYPSLLPIQPAAGNVKDAEQVRTIR